MSEMVYDVSSAKCKDDVDLRDRKRFQDLDQVVQDILQWENTIFNLQHENSDLCDKVSGLETTVSRLQSFCESGNETNARMHETVNSLQKLLETKLDQEEEIRFMRSKVVTLEQTFKGKEQELLKEVEIGKNKVAELVQRHAQQVQELKQDNAVEGNVI
ncbi:uncharacterized protein LOC104265724 [Ciona intestinalis]